MEIEVDKHKRDKISPYLYHLHISFFTLWIFHNGCNFSDFLALVCPSYRVFRYK